MRRSTRATAADRPVPAGSPPGAGDRTEYAVPALTTLGPHANLADAVWDNAAVDGDAVQFARPGPAGWRDVTCRTFRDEVAALAAGLIGAGVQPGDRIALMSKTRYEWTLVDYAIWAAGAVTVPVYETSSAEQVLWILADSGAVAVVVETPAHAAIVADLRGDLPALREAWCLDAGGLEAVRAAGAAVEAATVQARRHVAGPDDIATIIYTSGTTGRPKGCVLTHRNLYADIANTLPVMSELFHAGSSTLLFLPLAHAFARLIQLGMVYSRCRMGHVPDVKNLVADLAAFQPTFVLAVPRVFEKIYNTARLRAHADGRGAIFDRAERVAVAYSRALDAPGGPGIGLRLTHAALDRLVYVRLRTTLGGRCERAISGSAPLGERLAHFYRGIGVTIFEGYGLTETSPAVSANRDGAIRIGTVGQPLPGVTVRLAPDGEVLVAGEIVCRGYWNNPAATAEAIDPQGWFHTGDLGHLDADGYLSITGRKKELIVTAGGKNVAPAVLEDRLRVHPLISQCIVVGDRRPFIAALVTIDEEAWPRWLAGTGRDPATPVAALRADPVLRAVIQSAVDAANQAVSRAEAIREFRILGRDWTEAGGEITPSLKVKRNVVLKEYADEIAAIYAH